MTEIKELARGWRDAHGSVVALIASGLSPKSKQVGMRESAAKQAEARFDASLADAQAEIARLRGALEKCSTALYLAAPFADGCNVEDALTIEVGRAAAHGALQK